MMQLNLNPEENEILVGILGRCLSELRMEIANTDSQDYRDVLKQHKSVLAKTLEELGHSPT